MHATCVDLTDVLGLGSPSQLAPLRSEAGPVLMPIDRVTMELAWSPGGYPAHGTYRDYHRRTTHDHRPWGNDGRPYDHAAALELARSHAADFVARTIERLDRAAPELDQPPLAVCALDTELLGHWWYEGVSWLSSVLREAGRQGLAIRRLDDALAEREPVPVPASAGVTTWGSPRNLSTWDGPQVADLAWRARAAELAVRSRSTRPSAGVAARAAGPPGLRLGLHDHAIAGGPVSPRALGRALRGGAGRPRLGRLSRRRASQPGPTRDHRPASRPVTTCLILSWEYPPIVEGGLARHVRKLSEAMVAQGVEVHVLTRGDERMEADEDREGVHVHRVREPRRPRDLGEFVTWVEHMNADMLAAGVELGDRFDFDLVHGHDWLVAVAGDHLANRFRCPWSPRFTPPSTAATRDGSRTIPSPTSTGSRAGWPTAPTASSRARTTCAATWPTSTASRRSA